MNTRSEGLRICVPQVSSKADASSSYLMEKERNLGAEILELIKKSDYSYLEINKVLYALDRELQYRANNNKL
ncbi:hypothetical protein [Staphylococcus aureus]|uniref:hypothetical protein n=1 Tax=Staphylococcus aureus TaxID=1280 RepID=UPI0002CA8BA8|nr:hypothetical protein [Staphylococcus aureus]ENK41717.1 phage protein [Staphylococcus aureus M0494]